MRLTVTNYLDVISSWCFWATPAWRELRKRYHDRVDFRWKIALMDKSGLPPTREHTEWYYRRSGMLMRSPFLLDASWIEPGRAEYLEPNCVAEAARDLGIEDDRVWMALSHAELREGKKSATGKPRRRLRRKRAGFCLTNYCSAADRRRLRHAFASRRQNFTPCR